MCAFLSIFCGEGPVSRSQKIISQLFSFDLARLNQLCRTCFGSASSISLKERYSLKKGVPVTKIPLVSKFSDVYISKQKELK